MKTRFLAIGVALGITSLARAADFTPIAIDPSSFNQDPVVEATAPKPIADPTVVTHTTDGGTNKTGNTWYEVGYMTNSSGLPAHNSYQSRPGGASGDPRDSGMRYQRRPMFRLPAASR